MKTDVPEILLLPNLYREKERIKRTRDHLSSS